MLINERSGPIQAVRKNNWKAVKFKDKPIEIYDLNQDISERHNVAEQHPETTEALLYLINNTRTEHPEFPLVKKKLIIIYTT